MRRILPCLAFACLAGCTSDTVVTASLENGGIVFVVPDDVTCVDRPRVTDARRNELWSLGDPADGSSPCVPITSHRFRYGADLPGAVAARPAQPLVVGNSYALLAGPGALRAAFRYNGPATPPTNFPLHGAEWCAVHYPGTRPDWLGRCVS